MDYEIKMPILSDTMDKGKLIKWHVKEGDFVKKGDVIADVESDKAIMEVQTFKNGVVKKLLAKEGDEIPVKNPIAIIETGIEEVEGRREKVEEKKEEEEEGRRLKVEGKKEKKKEEIPPVIEEILEKPKKEPLPKGSASPAAKILAQKENIDILKLQKEKILPTPAHLKDIQEEVLKRYFTPKALKLLKEYHLNIENFELNHKIDSDEIEEYILKNNIPKIIYLSKNEKAVKKSVEESAKKPVYFIYETFDIKKYEGLKLTTIILKKIGDVMQKHPKTRAIIENDTYKIYPHSNISVAVAKNSELYMVVCKNVEEKSLEEIDSWVRGIKKREYSADELVGSTFGISNLGMFGIERFSAMIYQNDSAIAAFGALKNNKIDVTFTFDHRILNGIEAAKFVNDLKEEFKKDV
ncbi:2-oxo acid dehydrogenase subunit E2 [Nitrosophilus kaiyonis]|uniref:2-oxo acid dehydrogenase subunit E2 n=1 Tax=Nitrosophilus kaiyonis TaxID=2930200 RepID=UPI002490302A|nr:2-oxo acid dehydrogenase subunit E2 [Nitrosophilus kaiyonis]